MGECNYYLKARFSSPSKAKNALPRLLELLKEGDRAYEFWQNSRWLRDGGHLNWKPPSKEGFWEAFRERFPLVIDYLGRLADISDWSNGLAGQMSLVDPETHRGGAPKALLTRDRESLLLEMRDIWHCSDLRLLESYCRDQLAAIAVGSISEEEFERDSGGGSDARDFFDAIRLR